MAVVLIVGIKFTEYLKTPEVPAVQTPIATTTPEIEPKVFEITGTLNYIEQSNAPVTINPVPLRPQEPQQNETPEVIESPIKAVEIPPEPIKEVEKVYFLNKPTQESDDLGGGTCRARISWQTNIPAWFEIAQGSQINADYGNFTVLKRYDNLNTTGYFEMEIPCSTVRFIAIKALTEGSEDIIKFQLIQK